MQQLIKATRRYDWVAVDSNCSPWSQHPSWAITLMFVGWVFWAYVDSRRVGSGWLLRLWWWRATTNDPNYFFVLWKESVIDGFKVDELKKELEKWSLSKTRLKTKLKERLKKDMINWLPIVGVVEVWIVWGISNWKCSPSKDKRFGDLMRYNVEHHNMPFHISVFIFAAIYCLQ